VSDEDWVMLEYKYFSRADGDPADQSRSIGVLSESISGI
jgi:hypothetical protein